MEEAPIATANTITLRDAVRTALARERSVHRPPSAGTDGAHSPCQGRRRPPPTFFVRETRVLAYSQFLESYRSVSLASMAHTFGVSSEFLDDELSGFIAAERLSCKIDKVSGVVSSTRPDSKNAQYQAVIKEGDQLLNRLQKLSRVFNL